MASNKEHAHLNPTLLYCTGHQSSAFIFINVNSVSIKKEKKPQKAGYSSITESFYEINHKYGRIKHYKYVYQNYYKNFP